MGVLWTTATPINWTANVCPTGYHVPTKKEWSALLSTGNITKLKFAQSGWRKWDGSVTQDYMAYWCSDLTADNKYQIFNNFTSFSIQSNSHMAAVTVRCMKD